MIYSKLEPVGHLQDNQIETLFNLYSIYYGGTSQGLFYRDIQKKDYVIILSDSSDDIQGFSTVQILATEFEGKPIKILFSGDTIVAHGYWGKNNLAQEWIKFAGEIKHLTPHIPLYWFLIVKGHRTYRYLSLFSLNYYPAYGVETPCKEKKIMDQLATSLFGDAYDHHTGILHFPQSQGHLKEKWADISQKDLRHLEVQFFLENNPGYRQGDELVCLCELTEANLKPFAQRIFHPQGLRHV